jgi:transcriptional regulator with XRE-family HTH domain
VMQAGDPITDVTESPDPSEQHDLSTLAGRATWARKRLGLTQEGLAQAAGVTQSTIGNMESGLRQQPRKINAIAKALQLHVEWLEGGKGPRLLQDLPVRHGHHTAEPAAAYLASAVIGELSPRALQLARLYDAASEERKGRFEAAMTLVGLKVPAPDDIIGAPQSAPAARPPEGFEVTEGGSAPARHGRGKGVKR